MHFLLVFDADNTLWDTNSVFHEAHVAMLEVFEAIQILSGARHQVEQLRAIDRALIRHFGRFEYGFENLATAIAYHYGHQADPDAAAAYALAHGAQALAAPLREAVEQAYQTHANALEQIPPLFPGVADLLGHLLTYRTANPHMATVIFSEGHPQRLARTIDAYHIARHGYFNEIVIEAKTSQAFERVKHIGRRYLNIPDGDEVVTIMIGDSMQRDIRLANEAGYTTIYIPRSFEGRQEPQTALEQPDFELAHIAELPSILTSLGLHLPSSSLP
jgi:putative hydrolase of the HAD superfamily